MNYIQVYELLTDKKTKKIKEFYAGDLKSNKGISHTNCYRCIQCQGGTEKC